MTAVASTGPQPQPGILDIAAYVPGKSGEDGRKTHKLSSNESPLGPSPKAMAAFRDCAGHLHRYPDGGSTALREAIADRYGLNAERIVCGAGSDELLHLLAEAYLGPGTQAIYTAHGFLMYRIAIQTCGATPVIAPEKNYTTDVDAILERVNETTRLVFVANPNNPTGTYLPFDEVKRLQAGLPGGCLLVLDAAYAEYVRRNDYEAGVELVATGDNTVMTRTFSKAYGLAGLRLGWAYCPPGVADVLNRIRGPFNVNLPAIAAGVAAIGDTGHLDKAVALNAEWLPRVTAALEGLGLEVTPSVGNFVLVHFHDGARNAHAADGWLAARGVIVRRMDGYGLPNALRVTIGTAEANGALIAALEEFVAGAA